MELLSRTIAMSILTDMVATRNAGTEKNRRYGSSLELAPRLFGLAFVFPEYQFANRAAENKCAWPKL